MDVMQLAAAFGGGLMGAYMGGLPAFIMTGVFAIVGGLLTAAGAIGDSGFIIGTLAFGCFMGPHVSFAGGVAAAAYAAKKGVLKSGGADITAALNGTGEPDVLIVGGIFGALGYVIMTLISMTPLGALTDLPGITVVILGIAARLIFGSTGLTGKYTGEGPRQYISSGKGMVYNIVMGAGIGIAISFIAASLYEAGNMNALGIFPIILFGFSAVTLIFTQTGFAMPGTHHITLPSGLAAVAGVTAMGASGAWLGILFAIIASIMGDFFGRTFNSYCDSHIDPPACTIFILTIVVNLLKPVLG